MVSLFSVANKGSSEPDYEVGVEQVYVLNGMNELPDGPCHRLVTVTSISKGEYGYGSVLTGSSQGLGMKMVHLSNGLSKVINASESSMDVSNDATL